MLETHQPQTVRKAVQNIAVSTVFPYHCFILLKVKERLGDDINCTEIQGITWWLQPLISGETQEENAIHMRACSKFDDRIQCDANEHRCEFPCSILPQGFTPLILAINFNKLWENHRFSRLATAELSREKREKLRIKETVQKDFTKMPKSISKCVKRSLYQEGERFRGTVGTVLEMKMSRYE